MVVVMQAEASEDQIQTVIDRLVALGFDVHCSTGELSHLPILADPSHGTGRRDKVAPMTLAAVAAGADGLLLEVHNDPEKALSDGAQSLYFDQFEKLMVQLRALAPVVGRCVA